MSVATRAPKAKDKLARFELLRELGRGAQATVWLAHDPRLDREVALKLINVDNDPDAVDQWLNEARAVARLTHPHVVPVFEADFFGGRPYLVFEYVEGPTLAQARAPRSNKGPMPARDAVALMLGVLDALAAAHDQGLVHRDLKPSNVLLGGDGRARVMDFGIAARVAHKDGRIVGTAGYISPEAARGEPPVPAMDVFAAGVMLAELLSGGPLLRETDPMRALHRVQHEDLLLPDTAAVDGALRGIVQRALARDVNTRYDSARAMHSALAAWLNPNDEPEALSDANSATLEFLLRRLRHRPDFPALSASVVRIQRLADSDTDSAKQLSDEVLKDVALTHKLLRMVNTPRFTSAAGETVSTVSRAVALVGFAGVRNMALAVVLLEHMNDKAHAVKLKEEFLRALTAGTVADLLWPNPREGEAAFLGTLLQNLGRMLAECYLPEEATQIRQALSSTLPKGAAASTPSEQARDAAARKILGISLEELGTGVAKAWRLPEELQEAMRTPVGAVPANVVRGMGRDERLRWLGRGANALADAMLSADGDAQTAALLQVAERHASVFGVPAAEVVAAAHLARTQVKQLAQIMGAQVAPGEPARRLLEATYGAQATLADASTSATLPGSPTATPTQAALSQALFDLQTLSSNPGVQVVEILQHALNALHQALALRWVVLCLRHPSSGKLMGRIGIGAGASAVAADFDIKPDVKASTDLFSVLCARGSDLLISDASTVANRLPAWYTQRINAPTFLLLPLMHKSTAIGLIYADQVQAKGIELTAEELALVRALRDVIVTALSKGK
jgi:eukaryotic-like serine/threonine-protein kinase